MFVTVVKQPQFIISHTCEDTNFLNKDVSTKDVSTKQIITDVSTKQIINVFKKRYFQYCKIVYLSIMCNCLTKRVQLNTIEEHLLLYWS